MRPSDVFALHIAKALVNTDWSFQAMRSAVLEDLPSWINDEWVERLIAQILDKNLTPYSPSLVNLKRLILGCPSFWLIWTEAKGRIPLDRQSVYPAVFRPLPVFADLVIPPISSERECAEWLGLTLGELDWFAGQQSHRPSCDKQKAQNYYYLIRQKRSGDVRLIEAPKKRLKRIQRRILHEILDFVPIHDASHGFVKGRSVMSAAQLHGGETMLLKVDLADFFVSVPLRRCHGIFRSLGYPAQVARYLSGLTSSTVPHNVLAKMRAQSSKRLGFDQIARYKFPHLPQGAPTSPVLANLSCYRLDRRLTGLARRFDVNYTRYADDLAFSGGRAFANSHRKFLKLLYTIIEDENFMARYRKTRIMGAGARQQVTGIIVNQHLNLPREEFDRIKAVLHNCIKHEPSTQNREGHADFRGHLSGRIGWVEQLNPRRGYKLRQLFDQISW